MIGSTADLAKLRLAGDPLGDERDAQRIEHDWRLADIREGLPQIYAATREMFVAQMLNLDLIDGISFTKGCFTGQEIIARTQHLGRIKRRMFRLLLPAGAWAIGQAVHLGDGRAGRLTEVVSAGEEFEALAVLGLEASRAGGRCARRHDRGARITPALFTGAARLSARWRPSQSCLRPGSYCPCHCAPISASSISPWCVPD